MKKFSQEELNRIVATRVKRERERLTAEFENKMKKSMASIHLILHQEICAMRRDMATETLEPLAPPIWQNEEDEPILSGKACQMTGGEHE